MHFHQVLGDDRPGQRGAEQVAALVLGVPGDGRENEVADELLAQIVDEDLLDAELLGLLPCRLELFALT